MGDDYDRAEAEYWEVKGLGYTDEEIMAMDVYPTRPKDRYSVRRPKYDPAGPGPAPGYFDQDGTLSALDAARMSWAMTRKEATSPIGYRSGSVAEEGRALLRAMEENDRMHGIKPSESELLRRAREVRAAMKTKIHDQHNPKSAEIKRSMLMIDKTRVIADLKAAISAAQKELALLEKIPNEPGERMTSFTVTFAGSSKPYIYVGLRIDGMWKVSGRHFANSKYTWSGIFERFEAIHAKVEYISTPTEFRHEQVYS